MGWKDTIQEDTIQEDTKVSSWRDSIQDEVSTEPKSSAFEAVAGGISSGGTFGMDDELYGGIKAIGSSLGLMDDETSIMDDSSSFKQNYQAGRDQRRDYKKELAEERPVAFKGSEIVGAVGTGILTGGASLPAITAEAGLYGLGESEADLTEGEFADALIDTGIGAGIGLATAGVMKGGSKLVKSGYQKAFGKGGKDLATDAAGDILELTPKQRADASKDIIKMGPGKVSSVAEELPSYLKEKGGLIQSVKKLKAQAAESLDKSGKEIDDVLTTYQKTFDDIKAAKPDVRKMKGVDEVSTGVDEVATVFQPNQIKDMDQMASYMASKQAEVTERNLAFKFSDLADRLENNVVDYRRVAGSEPQIKQLEKHIAKLRKFKSKAGTNQIDQIKELHQYRRDTDRLIKSFINAPKQNASDALVQDALMQTRREMSEHLQVDMLGNMKKFAGELQEVGLIGKDKFDELVGLQDKIYKANRDYKLASYVDSQIDQSIGRKDARKLISLTDVITGATVGAGNPLAGVGAVAAKKVAEVVRPRAQLFSKEIGKGIANVGGMVKNPALQQTMQQTGTKKPGLSEEDANSFRRAYEAKVSGTKYAPLFEGMNEHQKAVRHSLLHETDEGYRSLGKEEE